MSRTSGFDGVTVSLQKKLNDSEYGNDLAAVEKEYDSHQKEHKIIHQFHTNVDQCAAAEVTLNLHIRASQYLAVWLSI